MATGTLEYRVKVNCGFVDIEKEKREVPHIAEHLISHHFQKKFGFYYREAYTSVDHTMYIFDRLGMAKKTPEEIKAEFLSILKDFDFSDEELEIEKKIIKEERLFWPYKIHTYDKYYENGYIQLILYGGEKSFPDSNSLDIISKTDIKNYINENYKEKKLEIFRGTTYDKSKISSLKKINFDLDKSKYDLRVSGLSCENSSDYKIVVLKCVKTDEVYPENIKQDFDDMWVFYRNPNYQHYRTHVSIVPYDLTQSEDEQEKCIVFFGKEDFNIQNFLKFAEKNKKLTRYLKENEIEKLFSSITEIIFTLESKC